MDALVEWKLITIYALIKEKFTFLYWSGSKENHSIHSSSQRVNEIDFLFMEEANQIKFSIEFGELTK